MWRVCDISSGRLRVAGAVHRHSSVLLGELAVRSVWQHVWQELGFVAAKGGLRWSMLVHGRRPLCLRWQSVKCHSRYLGEVVEALCRVSQSSHGRVEDPNWEAVAAGPEMVEAPVEEHKWLPQNFDLVVVLEAAHILNWTRHIPVVDLEGFGTSQSAQGCVAAVAEEDCNMGCRIVTAVDLLLVNWRNQTPDDL